MSFGGACAIGVDFAGTWPFLTCNEAKKASLEMQELSQ